MSQIGPIFRALMRNKVGALLIALQVAVTMTIIVNAIHLINARGDLMGRSSGLDEANQFYVTSVGYANDFDAPYVIDTDLDGIRQLPSVDDAVQINAIPMSNGGWSMGLQTKAGEGENSVPTALYMTDEHGINTLDVELIAGENFKATEISYRDRNTRDWPQSVILTEALAKSLFPDLSPTEIVGQTVYIQSNEPLTIIGIMDHLQAPWTGWTTVNHSMLVPNKFDSPYSRYLVRAKPGQREQAIEQVEQFMKQREVGRMVRETETMTQVRMDSYRGDSALQAILWTIIVVLCIITALGIVGLVSFSINRRRRQIGTRRALGAQKADIMSYFLTENVMITSVGVILGIAGSIALNMWLVSSFNLPRLSYIYLPIAMIAMWTIGLFAVWGPALRAAQISPAIATRNV